MNIKDAYEGAPEPPIMNKGMSQAAHKCLAMLRAFFNVVLTLETLHGHLSSLLVTRSTSDSVSMITSSPPSSSPALRRELKSGG